jgi:hypothetical protein
MSDAARRMHHEWESPELWPGIRRALAGEAVRPKPRLGFWARPAAEPAAYWRPLAAAALLLLITTAAAWILLRSPGAPPAPAPTADLPSRLLTEEALADAERSERAYAESIEKLSRLVQPRLNQSSSPLLLAYREKLLLIDEAIAECRENIGQNRFNAHLRRELLEMYQAKQQTLQALMKEN